MTSVPAQRPTSSTLAWWTVCALLLLGMLTVPMLQGAPTLDAPWRALLDWQPGQAGAQPWRWWTPVAVHYSALHWGGNLAGLLLVGCLGHVARLPRAAAIAWCVAWPLGHLALGLRPDLLHYGGSSGVLHAGVAVAALWLLLRRQGAPRWIGAVLGAGLVFKVLGESPWGPALQSRAGWDILVAPWAHATGTLAGAACGAAAAWLSACRTPTGTACAHRP